MFFVEHFYKIVRGKRFRGFQKIFRSGKLIILKKWQKTSKKLSTIYPQFYPHVDNFIHILSTEILFALKCDKIHKKRRKNVIYYETFENKK